jgi:hypothetical protein
MRPILLAVAFLAGACTSDTFVDDLSTSSQINLCEDFLDDYCATPGGAGFCDDPCIDTGCRAAVENGDVDLDCAGVFVSEVDDCGFTGDAFDCPVSGGGCIIDALEATCP